MLGGHRPGPARALVYLLRFKLLARAYEAELRLVPQLGFISSSLRKSQFLKILSREVLNTLASSFSYDVRVVGAKDFWLL